MEKVQFKEVGSEGEAWRLMRGHRQHECPASTADTIIPPLGGPSMVKCHECGLEIHFGSTTSFKKG